MAGKHPLVNGHKIHFRREQMLLFGILAGVLGSGFIAGLYYLVLQQDWGAFLGHPHSGATLKNWWDSGMGIFHSGNWLAYRHGVRDEGEPAAAVLLTGTFLAKTKTGQHLVGIRRMIATLLVLLALVIAGSVFITWVINFGPLHKVSDAFQWQEILLGAVLGHLLRFIWTPVGATIQASLVGRTGGGTPLWVTLPLLPPVWRERWSEMAHSKEEEHHGWVRAGIIAMALLFLIVSVVGNIAKYIISKGTHVPYLNP